MLPHSQQDKAEIILTFANFPLPTSSAPAIPGMTQAGNPHLCGPALVRPILWKECFGCVATLPSSS